jgi:hypothetical protein
VPTPGIEKLGGGVAAGVPVDVSPGTEVEPAPLSSGGVPDPTSCAKVMRGDNEKENVRTTAKSFLIKSSRIRPHEERRPIVLNDPNAREYTRLEKSQVAEVVKVLAKYLWKQLTNVDAVLERKVISATRDGRGINQTFLFSAARVCKIAKVLDGATAQTSKKVIHSSLKNRCNSIVVSCKYLHTFSPRGWQRSPVWHCRFSVQYGAHPPGPKLNPILPSRRVVST